MGGLERGEEEEEEEKLLRNQSVRDDQLMYSTKLRIERKSAVGKTKPLPLRNKCAKRHIYDNTKVHAVRKITKLRPPSTALGEEKFLLLLLLCIRLPRGERTCTTSTFVLLSGPCV